MMKRPISALLMLALATTCAAQQLTEPERQALLERLEEIKDSAHSTANTRFEAAERAFRAGLQSEKAALELYLKCVEKADFEEQQLDSRDFREWRRRKEDEYEADGFALALRHQLNWLAVSLRRAAGAKPERLGLAASEALDRLFLDAANLRGHAEVLSKDVFDSAFARAYGLGGMDLEGWPSAPLPPGRVFEQVILPPLRSASTVEELRTAWQRRIQCESLLVEQIKGPERDSDDPPAPAFARFLMEDQPQLEWEMEEDVFNSGDPKGAALRMLAHLEEHIAHRNAREWAESFRKLVDPDADAAGAILDDPDPATGEP